MSCCYSRTSTLRLIVNEIVRPRWWRMLTAGQPVTLERDTDLNGWKAANPINWTLERYTRVPGDTHDTLNAVYEQRGRPRVRFDDVAGWSITMEDVELLNESLNLNGRSSFNGPIGFNAAAPINGCWVGTAEVTCDSFNYDWQLFQNNTTQPNIPLAQKWAGQVMNNPCCKVEDRCIHSALSKTDDGYCCPLTEYQTLFADLRTLNLNTGCLNITGDEDGKYLDWLTNPNDTKHQIDQVTPPSGVAARWEKTIASGIRWEDYSSTNGTCSSSLGTRDGDIIIRLSLVPGSMTFEVITDMPVGGIGTDPFKDLLFKRSFAVASDCSDFGGTIQNAFGSTDAGVGVTTDRTPGTDEQDLDGETEFIMGWGGSATLSVT